MLSIQAIQAAYPLAAKLDERGLSLVPTEGSLLSTLVRDCGNYLATTYKDGGVVEVNPEYIAQFINDRDPVSGLNNHTLDMDEIVEQVSGKVLGHLNVARTVVAPAIDDLVTKILPQLEQASRSTMSDLEVITWTTPAPLLEPALIDAVGNSKSSPVEDFILGMRLPEVPEVEIVEFMKSGSSSLDAAVGTFLSTLEPGALGKIWCTLFMQSPVGAPDQKFYEVCNDSPLGLAHAIVGYLVAKKLWKKPIEGVNMTAQRYEDEMILLREQCALRLLRELDLLDRQVKNGTLVRSYTRTTITVNERVYNEFIKQGGSNEILLGNLMRPDVKVHLDLILESKDKCLEMWRAFQLANRTTEANKRFAACKSIARLEFLASLRALSPEELPVQDIQTITKLFDDQLALTTEAEIADPYRWVMRLVCGSRFWKTDAYRILDDLARIRKDNPGVEVREAADISARNYICYWVGQQFKLTPCLR